MTITQNYEPMDSIDTVIEFEIPVRISHITFNSLPFENIENVIIEETNMRVGDSPDARNYESDAWNKNFLKISYGTKSLAVTTLDLSKVYRKPVYATSVRRAECIHAAEGVLIKIPMVCDIEEIKTEIMRTKKSAKQNHGGAVSQIMSKYSANVPRIIYEGRFLHEARLDGWQFKTE